MNNSSGENGRWLWQNLEIKLGDRGKTKFWDEVWLGETSFGNSFPKLYNLRCKKIVLSRKWGAKRRGVGCGDGHGGENSSVGRLMPSIPCLLC